MRFLHLTFYEARIENKAQFWTGQMDKMHHGGVRTLAAGLYKCTLRTSNAARKIQFLFKSTKTDGATQSSFWPYFGPWTLLFGYILHGLKKYFILSPA